MMTEQYIKMLNPYEVINENMPLIIESFTLVYGEENREFIKEKLRNTIWIFHEDPRNLANRIDKILKETSKKLNDLFISEAKIPEDEVNKYLGSSGDMKYPSLIPISKYAEFLKYYDMSEEERKELAKEEKVNYFQRYFKEITFDNFDDFIKTKNFQEKKEKLPENIQNNLDFYQNLKEPNKYLDAKKRAVSFLKEFNSNVNEDNIEDFLKQGIFDDINQKTRIYMKYQTEYNSYKNNFQKEISYTNKCLALKEKIFHEAKRKFIIEFSSYLDKDELEKFKQNKIGNYEKINAIVGFSINSTPLLASFSTESEEILKSGSEWQKDNIISDRIRFYQKMGIDLGDDYQNYLNDPRCKNVVPPIDIIDKILKRKEEYINDALREYYTSIKEYTSNRERITAEGLLCQDDYDADTYLAHSTYVSPNAKLVNGKLIPFNIISISLDAIPEFLDHYIIHELNHVIETSIVSTTENGIDFVSGWDFLHQNFHNNPQIPDNGEKRKYELLNEIFNEIIAQKVSRKLHDKNIHFFNTAENAKFEHGASYQNTFFLVKNFYEQYEKEIMESRRNNNIEILFKHVGKENFDALADLFAIFNTHFNGFNYYHLIDDLKKGVQSEQVKIYEELITKRDKILRDMEAYHAKTK